MRSAMLLAQQLALLSARRMAQPLVSPSVLRSATWSAMLLVSLSDQPSVTPLVLRTAMQKVPPWD